MDAGTSFLKESDAAIAKRKADADKSYRRAGIEPPVWQPGQIPVTLQMRLLSGWRIERDADGFKILVEPVDIREENP